MTITTAHRSSSHRRTDKTCRDCREIYSVSVTATRSTRCPACQARHETELRMEREALNRRKRQGYYKQGTDSLFWVVADPGETWGWNSYLSRKDIKELLRLGYFEPGTEFVRAGERLVVEAAAPATAGGSPCDGELRLAVMEG